MKIITQSVFDKWPLEDNSVQAIITSPPYYFKRVYHITDTIIGGNKECEHVLNETNFCTKCNGWLGQYGNEPSFQQFISSTLLWCKEVYRVLRDDGLFFLNMGTTYSNKDAEPTYLLRNDLTEEEVNYVLTELAKNKEK